MGGLYNNEVLKYGTFKHRQIILPLFIRFRGPQSVCVEGGGDPLLHLIRGIRAGEETL